MNVCFVWAKIKTDIEFKFFYNSKIHNSVVEFMAEINPNDNSNSSKKQMIFLKAYDDNADYIYRKYKKGKNIKIMGKITSKHIDIIEII